MNWKKGDFVPFSPPRIDDLVINEVVDTLKSGWITTGPKTKLFEKKIAKYCGVQKCVAVNSATAGLELVLRWFGVKKNDEVIVPAYTYCATANVVIHCGARPVIVDIYNDDLTINVDEIKKAITPKTKVIIPVDIAGLPCRYDEIFEIVNDPQIKKYFTPLNPIQQKLGRILILADAAHSFGAEYKSKKIGSVADITVFSFHAIKNLTTAEGGAITFNLPQFEADELYEFFSIMALHGQTKDAFSKTLTGKWQYDVIDAGFKCNMTDIHASIGLVEIDRYENDTLVKRKKIFDTYTNNFVKYEWAIVPLYEDVNRKSSYHVYCLRIRGITENIRNNIIDEIYKNNVSVNVHFQPLPLLSAYKKRGYTIENYPVAYAAYSCEISLPVYYDLTEDMQQQVIEAVIKSTTKFV
ncbi:MAG: DegT/DnrJ/EryC1/StrS family aminotransferase [Bacteroidales bacterium]|nr:DegT/DnrJ/EryC1/StrS family aminotransferase [Bacteroidales bacterium]